MDWIEVFNRLKRDSVTIVSEESLQKRLGEGKRLRIKLGADPSRPDLHLGHSVVLRKLRLLQELGHEIVFVIGDFTGMIGDPSGKSKTRVPLTFEQTRENGRSYFEQVTKLLDPERTSIVYNSDWLSKMSFGEVLALAGKYTLAQIMERDDFAKRYGENAPIGLHELLYPLMQGYDSVALRADMEVGGSDQTFNLLVGRELQRDYGQPPQEVITFPLLPGLDGKEKMSKSLDNYIGIDEPPEVMFEKCMRVPDALLEDYFRLTTELTEDEYAPLLERDPYEAHLRYGGEIVTLYWGAKASADAAERYREVARGSIPEALPTLHWPSPSATLTALTRFAGYAASNGEARRLIEGRGIRIDGEISDNPLAAVEGKKELVLGKGKNRFVRITLGD